MDGWVLSRYEDVLSVLHDPRFSADEQNLPGFDKFIERRKKLGLMDPDEEVPVSMLRSDAPDHTRLRKLVSKAFTPHAIAALAPKIDRLVREHLDAVAARGEMDLIADLASPLPVIVIAELIGVPREDRDRFKHWSNEIVRSIGFSNIHDERASVMAGRELRAYFQEMANQRREDPRDDLMSGLLQAEEEGDRLTLPEVFGLLELILIAGNETTTNLIGNGMLALLRNPDQLEALQRDPSLLHSAVEELLRYDGPVQATSRIALDDLEFRGAKLRKGQNVMILIGSANHDPDQFDDPYRLDIRRSPNEHIAFGHGVHFCLGSHLARMEGRAAIAALVERFPSMKLATDRPRWRRNIILHGLKELPVRF
jgi:cytochrome P450